VIFGPVQVDGPWASDSTVAGGLILVVTMLVGVLVFLVRTFSATRQVNQAVNNVGPGEHSLWDQVSFIREDISVLVEAQKDFAEKGWRTLPDDIGTASRLTETIRHLQAGAEGNERDHARIVADLEKLSAILSEHDRWERARDVDRGT